jgi:hypothetical protein
MMVASWHLLYLGFGIPNTQILEFRSQITSSPSKNLVFYSLLYILDLFIRTVNSMSLNLSEEFKQNCIQQVVGMGFSEEQAILALQMSDYDVTRATDLIVQGGNI